MTGLSWEKVTFAYTEGGRPVLENTSLAVDPGRITLLTGPSGCGKSTLLYLAAGLYPQNAGHLAAGQVLLEGGPVGNLPPERRALRIGMVFQNPDLQFCMDTVENELIFCLENVGFSPAAMDAEVEETLAFCDAAHLKTRPLITLSGGEKQRVMLACMVALGPRWLLLDEPFANMDGASARSLAKKLQQLHRERGVNILAVDHHLAVWRDLIDEVIVLQPGGAVAARIGTPLGKASLEQWGIDDPDTPYQAGPLPKTPQEPETALRIRALSVELGGAPILRDLDADFTRGRVHAITGDSGSGKSTLLGALCRLLPYRGRVYVGDRELGRRAGQDPGSRMGFVFQSPQDQFVAGSVFEEIALGLKKRLGRKQVAEEVERILRDTGLWRYRLLSPYMLSQGQQRRLGVAALLAYDCDVLVCDEPTYAQDRGATLALMGSLQRQVVERGLTLIFSTHDQKLARDFADMTYHMKGGRLYAGHQPHL